MISPRTLVGIPLTRAVLCPNDETVYDAELWTACPTCENEDRISLARVLGHHYLGGASAIPNRRVSAGRTRPS